MREKSEGGEGLAAETGDGRVEIDGKSRVSVCFERVVKRVQGDIPHRSLFLPHWGSVKDRRDEEAVSESVSTMMEGSVQRAGPATTVKRVEAALLNSCCCCCYCCCACIAALASVDLCTPV